ncbi:ribonuclease H-like domain-containing protein [Tanacetum coccineum]
MRKLLSAIPDRHLLSFHDAIDAKTLWLAIKARFGGNEASKKMQKNLLKQQSETFTIGSREELDSAYEKFQNILSMLELYDAKVSNEDANLKFLRSLPSVWHVVATMIRGQPGLDELEFDDLYNNLKVYEHELKGVSISSSQNIAFLSTKVKGSTLKQSTADPSNIPKGYTQAPSSKDAIEEIDIRWQVDMITARIRKFMRKTGRPIDLKPKNGITFDKSKIECFNCQKLGHFARECRFAKYQENRANGHKEKKFVAIEAARTMLADSLLPIQFWAEVVNTACYVLNRVLVTKPQMKTPYEILMGRSPNISFMRPFGCPLTILNTLDQLGKFDGKSEEGYLLGYSTSSKGFRVYNRVTRKVQDCLHVDFLENQENQKGKGPDWMFDLELLTPLM